MELPNQIIENATLVIRDNTIQSVNDFVPNDAKVIDGKGKWLIPELIDMHVHLPNDFSLIKEYPSQSTDIRFNVQDLMIPFIANGVITIFNLNANVESFNQRKEIQNDLVISPRMVLAFLIDGGKRNGKMANTPEEGRQTVRIAKAEDYEFIKLYSGLNIETYNAIVDESNKQGLKTVGHIPNVFRSDLKGAFVPHFNLVAHAEEFSKSALNFTYEEALSFAKIAKENNTWVIPTLNAMEWIANQSRTLDTLKALHTIQYIHPLLQSKWLKANSYNKNSSPESIAYFDKIVAFQPLLVRAFKELNVPILVGTDYGVSGVVSGFSLLDELDLLVKAGLTPEEALSSATRLSAFWLGMEGKIGTIQAGKLADLILLDENPLKDIKNVKKFEGVFVNGKWLNKNEIAVMLSRLAESNSDLKEQFEWNKTMKR